MTAFSIIDASAAGLRLVREKPRAVIVWSGVGLVVMAAVMAIFFVMGGDHIASITATLQSGTITDPEALYALYKPLFPAYGVSAAVSMLAYCLLAPAIYRAILQPQLAAPGYIHIGMDEVRQLGVVFVVGAILFGIDTLASAALVAAAKASGSTAIANFGSVLVFVALVFISVRLSLAGPLSLVTRRLDIIESWRLTRGHSGRMLAAYLLVGVFLFLIGMGSTVVLLVISAAMSASTALGGVGAALQLIAGVLFLVFMALIYGLAMAVTTAPAALIYRSLAASKV